MFFLCLLKSYLSSVRYCTRAHWTRYFLKRYKNTAMFNWSPCICRCCPLVHVDALTGLDIRIAAAISLTVILICLIAGVSENVEKQNERE